jgi:hypothetical protein
MESEFLEQYAMCIYAIVGHSVTQSKATKDFATILFSDSIQYLNSGRINVDFKNELEKFKGFFSKPPLNKSTLPPMDEDLIEKLQNSKYFNQSARYSMPI